MKPRIALVGGLDASAESLLDCRADLVRVQDWSEASLAAAVEDCDALIVRTFVPVTRRVLEGAKRLRVVGVAGVGTDRIDTRVAADRGVAVLNMADAASDAVAEFTIALMLGLLRPVSRLMGEYQAGRFERARKTPHGVELRELTVGILGLGRIGSRVARICSAGFGARVLFHDIVDKSELPFTARTCGLQELLTSSDMLTLHVPLDESTRGLLNAPRLAQMKSSARLINTARGEVVSTAALTEALSAGRLAGAALDVIDPEPLPAEHPLFALPNCILTPHVAARSVGGLQRMSEIAGRVLKFLGG
ncbi:MAG: hypothetical protein JNG88_06840 [Phycisphaerales bacterium]|nr:hypothetical protein [Phycisphaerales bacterium]